MWKTQLFSVTRIIVHMHYLILLFFFFFSFPYRDFTNSYEPFVIPEYLRGQLEEFEALCDVSNSNSYQRLLDNNPDQTCESLYEYVYVSVLSSLKGLMLLHNFCNALSPEFESWWSGICRYVLMLWNSCIFLVRCGQARVLQKIFMLG